MLVLPSVFEMPLKEKLTWRGLLIFCYLVIFLLRCIIKKRCVVLQQWLFPFWLLHEWTRQYELEAVPSILLNVFHLWDDRLGGEIIKDWWEEALEAVRAQHHRIGRFQLFRLVRGTR